MDVMLIQKRKYILLVPQTLMMIFNRGVPTKVEINVGKSLTVHLRRQLGSDFEFTN